MDHFGDLNPTEEGPAALEAALWREVGLHLWLEDSAGRMAALLARHFSLRLLLVRRFEVEPAALVTVAGGGPDGSSSGAGERSALGEAAVALLGRVFAQGSPQRLPGGHGEAPEMLGRSSEHDVVLLPLENAFERFGVVVVELTRGEAVDDDLLRAALLPLRVAFENDARLAELSRMRAALEADRHALLARLHRPEISEAVVGARGGLRGVMTRIEQVAPTLAPVLILGETGSGKEVVARAIHARSRRSEGPIVRINCGAIPGELIDSELFGHERGAFTGAASARKGWFERADGGTLFLDEIGELSLAAQVRLLRVLQEGTLERVGGTRTVGVDVRVIAATHRQLETMVAEGRFREDLWYRLNVFPIRLPALRERMEDLPELVTFLAERVGRRVCGRAVPVTKDDLALLAAQTWPGNVRELSSVIERAAILGGGRRLDLRGALQAGSIPPPTVPLSAPPGELRATASPGLGSGWAANDAWFTDPSTAPSTGHDSLDPSEHICALDEAMRGHIERALLACRGKIEGPHGTAALLRINPHTLRARMRKLQLDWRAYRR